MYICDKCRTLTEELPSYKEARPWGSTVAYEEIVECDCACGGTFMNAKQCEHCGEYAPEMDIEAGCCAECQEELLKQIREFMKDFTEEQQIFMLENC